LTGKVFLEREEPFVALIKATDLARRKVPRQSGVVPPPGQRKSPETRAFGERRRADLNRRMRVLQHLIRLWSTLIRLSANRG